MKASELMIGDFLRYKQDYPYTHLQGKIVKVCGIRGRVDVITIDDGNFYESVHPDWLEPIPLTPEILEKNEFEVRGKRKYFLVPGDPSLALKREPNIGANGNSFVIGHFWEKDKCFRWFVEITYVHELQHALRLCGVEKEITI